MRRRLRLAAPDRRGDRATRSSTASSRATRRDPSPVIAGAPSAVRRIAATRPVAIASSSHPRRHRRRRRRARPPRRIRRRRLVGRGRRAASRRRTSTSWRRRSSASRRDALPRGRGLAQRRPGRQGGGRDRRARPERRACRPPAMPATARTSSLDRARGPRPRTRCPPEAPSARRVDSARGAAPHGRSRPPAVPRSASVRFVIRLDRPRAVPRPCRGSRAPAPTGPAIYCINHLNWADPLILLAVLPATAEARDVRPQGGGHDARAPGTG